MYFRRQFQSKIITLSLILLVGATSLPPSGNAQTANLDPDITQPIKGRSGPALGADASIAPPANDFWTNATVLGTEEGITVGTNVDATIEQGEPIHAGSLGHSVWYRWQAPPQSIGVTFTTIGGTTNYDTVLAVYTGASVNALTPVASNDDHGNGTSSSLTFPTVPNVTYTIAVDGFDSATGSFGLQWHHNRLAFRGSNYDGLGPDDLTVFRPSNGTWYSLQGGSFVAVPFGANGDVRVPADYDGDEKADIAVFRPSDGNWYILFSSTSSFHTANWGTAGDKPVPGDYIGRGFAELAVYRPSNGTWYLSPAFFGGPDRSFNFGSSGDKPAPADYDGDGVLDIGVFRPSNGTWYVVTSRASAFFALPFGQAGDVPIPGDYGSEADGKSDVAVFRPTNGTWYVRTSRFGSFFAKPWGINGDIPQPSYLSGSSTSFVVFRPSTSTWYMQNPAGVVTAQPFGAAGDIPATSAYPTQF